MICSEKKDDKKLCFASDYMEGAHPAILERLVETNLEKTTGYGSDGYSEHARECIRKYCSCPEAAVYFLVGGTQTNATVIGALLRSYQGVISADTGHITHHEAGAIELGGHKVLTLPHQLGKISVEGIRGFMEGYYADQNREHGVMPAMVYLSHPTEYGTLYTLPEIRAIRKVCDEYGLLLYLDGARLAYALSCPGTDLTLPDLAELFDVFYIGGTKCGALFGEAVVIPHPDLIPGFFTIIKQHGALLAKGRLLGLQFETLFSDDLYLKIGKTAIETADYIRKVLDEKGYRQYYVTPTNQIFVILDQEQISRLSPLVEYGFWEKLDDDHTVIRLATSWATTMEDVEKLAQLL